MFGLFKRKSKDSHKTSTSGEFVSKAPMHFEDAKVLFLYRKNSFYDKIAETLNKEYGNKVRSLVIPESTTNLTESELIELSDIIKDAKEHNVQVLCDETVPNMLGENLGEYQSLRKIVAENMRADGTLKTNSDSYISTLEKIAKKSKEIGAENVLISLIGAYPPSEMVPAPHYSAGSDIDNHGLTIKDNNGNEIENPISTHLTAQKIQETYDFLKIPFEAQGLNVIPAMYDRKSTTIVPLEDCIFETNKATIIKTPKTKNMDTTNSVILADRHQKISTDKFKRLYHLHENAVIEEKSSDEASIYHTHLDSGSEESIKMMAQYLAKNFKL